MNRRKPKIIAASAMLAAAMAIWVIAGIKNTSMRRFTPDELIADAEAVDNKGVQVEGFIAEGTTEWNAVKFELTFAVQDRSRKASVNVIYANKLRPDNFKDGGNVFVQGIYHQSQNLIVASKLQTKCASKYEAVDSVAAKSSGTTQGNY
jgi:cytochrome c-type biogenesis protein CcmE